MREDGPMDANQAISAVLAEIRSSGEPYPTRNLVVDRFWGGWCVYAPEMVADNDEDESMTRTIFLVDGYGSVREVSSTEPAEDARSHFAEACLWFAGSGVPDDWQTDPSIPSHPDFDRFATPRPPRATTVFDQQALAAFAEALSHERDFAGWLSGRLRELGELLGGPGLLVARRPNAPAAERVRALAAPEGDGRPAEVWRTWPPVEPETLPDVDTDGWLLVPGDVAYEAMAELGSETDAATRLSAAIVDHLQRAPGWRACRVADLAPRFVAVRRDERFAADLAAVRRHAAESQEEQYVDRLFLPPAPGDVDVLLRLAIDAQQRGRPVIDVGAAATSAYRRVLDRIDLPFEVDWFDLMSE
ncbi:hypothetical protein DFJ66_7967 [Saccharothrix variisporea]|uniref:Uncharacterized protein n=2 Tax=Saccharothrix variisporea TaxID=543527 RepID=A0A495XNX6_9PSEU|nr:hypothetical protein DFJ66_7967 [Saccharothrix variisporea]